MSDRDGTAPYVTPWLAKLGLKGGDYYQNTKPRGRRMMLASLSGDARRVYACLELATMGYQQELAVILEDGKPRPLTPVDIVRQTKLDKPRVRRALRELEEEGLGECRGAEGGPMVKGKIEIYSWAVPRTAKQINGGCARPLFPDWFPDSWAAFKSLIKRLKLDLDPDLEVPRDLILEGEAVARDLENAQKKARAILEQVRAQSPHHIKKETERNTERNGEPSSSGLSVKEPETTTPSPTENISENHSPGNGDPLPKAILDALRNSILNPTFSHRTAEDLVAQVRRMAAERNESLSNIEIVECIHDAWISSRRRAGNIGFYKTALPEKIEALFERRERERADRADREAVEAQATRRKLEQEAVWGPSKGITEQNPWELIKEQLRHKLAAESFENWIARSRFAGVNGRTVLVDVPDAHTVSFLQEEYSQQINSVAQGLGFDGVVFKVFERSLGTSR